LIFVRGRSKRFRSLGLLLRLEIRAFWEMEGKGREGKLRVMI
jgi:hypothetical protein